MTDNHLCVCSFYVPICIDYASSEQCSPIMKQLAMHEVVLSGIVLVQGSTQRICACKGQCTPSWKGTP